MTCLPCLAQMSEKYTLKKARKENKENPDLQGEEDDQCLGLSKLKLDLFLETISADDITSFTALVDISPLIYGETTLREKGDRLAKSIWDCLKYRFM